MCETFFIIILVLSFSECLSGSTLQDKSQQYMTPRYNSDLFVNRYGGTAFGPGVNPFGQNFINSESINNSPNYALHSQPANPPIGDTNTNLAAAEGNKNETSTKDETFLQLPVAVGGPPKVAISEFASQTFPENVMSALKINASNMFPAVSYSGQPGMLGIGEQVPLQEVIPEQSSLPQRQYMPFALRNVSATRISSPIFEGHPGMEGSKQQAIPATNYDRNTPTPLYSGYPGMLGTGQMYNNMADRINAPVDTRHDSISQGYSNKDQPGYKNSGVNVNENNYISTGPGVNANNWKGEWPGKTAAGGDWSGDWTDKWPKGDTHGKEDTKDANSLGFGSSESQSGSQMDWDGSWPGSTAKEEEAKKTSNDFGNFGETMAALQKLMNMLNDIPESADDKSNSRASPQSFSQMVAGWKEEMRP